VKRGRALVDTQTYYVTAPRGYRSSWMDQESAKLHADQVREQMLLAGWSGEVRVYYRDGSEVAPAREVEP
jgi:hypothetical protein